MESSLSESETKELIEFAKKLGLTDAVEVLDNLPRLTDSELNELAQRLTGEATFEALVTKLKDLVGYPEFDLKEGTKKKDAITLVFALLNAGCGLDPRIWFQFRNRVYSARPSGV